MCNASSAEHRSTAFSRSRAHELIESFEQLGNEDRVKIDGPVTMPNDATAELIANAGVTTPLLVDALRDRRSNIRRYAAYTLGEIGGKQLAAPLRQALEREFALAQAENGVVPEGQKANLATFRAIAAAYGRVDRRAAICFLMSSFDCANPFKSNASNAGLAELFPDALLYVGRRRVWWWSCDSRRDWETVARCGP
jgi:hypothetical protein